MKLPIQVEGFIFRQAANQDEERRIGGSVLEFLALHRAPERGRFWQPLTGGVEDYDANNEAALVREIDEELKISPDKILRIIPLAFQFSFTGSEGTELTEYAYGVEVDPTVEVSLSEEHDALEWGPAEVVSGLLKWEENKQALRELLIVLEPTLTD